MLQLDFAVVSSLVWDSSNSEIEDRFSFAFGLEKDLLADEATVCLWSEHRL